MEINNVFESLLNSSDYFLQNKDINTPVLGTPSSIEIYVNMLYRLIIDNPQLIEKEENKNNFNVVVMKIARDLAQDQWDDIKEEIKSYNKTLDEYILQDWVNNEETENYYVGKGKTDRYSDKKAYFMYGVIFCQTRRMLKKK